MAQSVLKTKAYEEIKKDIVSNAYMPGQMLNEELLRDRLQISRTPIRDAISRLEQEGFVTIKKKKGILVSPINEDILNEVYNSRILIECYALEAGFDRLDKAELEEMKALHCALNERKVVGRADFRPVDRALHSYFVSSLSNRFLSSTYEKLQDWNARIGNYSTLRGVDKIHTGLDEHIEILDCCLDHDKKGAEDAMRHHLENARAYSLGNLRRIAETVK